PWPSARSAISSPGSPRSAPRAETRRPAGPRVSRTFDDQRERRRRTAASASPASSTSGAPLAGEPSVRQPQPPTSLADLSPPAPSGEPPSLGLPPAPPTPPLLELVVPAPRHAPF